VTNLGSVLCPGCHLPLAGSNFTAATLNRCPNCQRRILVEMFPALHRPLSAGVVGERILEEGVSSCFYHDQKKAVISCDGCGRFLCALCDVEFNRQHLCPPCLQTSQTKGKIPTLDSDRVLWDSAALVISVLPMVFTPLLALGFAIFSFFRPSSLVSRTRIRAYLAIVLSLLQILFWVFVFSKA
jgi:hypothetical protein